jgi:DNA mismatch repair protein MSH2
MPDFSRLSKRFQTGKANLDDVVRAYQAVQALPLIVEVLEKLGGEDREESLVTLLEETYLAKLHVSNGR